MSRVQLALNVADLDEAVAFYTELFGTAPAKVRPGYANFAVADPPLKLVLIDDAIQPPGTLNHLGVEVATTGEVVAAGERLAAAGVTTTVEDRTTCCYALQDKVWVEGPPGHLWEVYTVLADAEQPASGDATPSAAAPDAALCCAARPDLAAPGAVAGRCC